MIKLNEFKKFYLCHFVKEFNLFRLIFFCFLIIAFSPVEAAATNTVEGAIAWAEAQGVGDNWDEANSRPWASWCLHFVGRTYLNSIAGDASAIVAWNRDDDKYGPRTTNQCPPRGALVFFDAVAANSYFGHVGLSVGDGTMWHAWTDGIRHDSISNYSYYLGWRWPDAWTGDEAYAASFHSQNPIDPTYEANSYQEFTLSYTNEGSTDWKNSGGVDSCQYIELRSVNSSGTGTVDSEIWPGNGSAPLWINAQRVVSPYYANVAPGENAWFIFTAKMPSTPGDYYFYFRPYHAMGGFIGQVRYFHVNVTGSSNSTTTYLSNSTTTYRSTTTFRSTTTYRSSSTTTYRSSSTTTHRSSTTTYQPNSTTTYNAYDAEFNSQNPVGDLTYPADSTHSFTLSYTNTGTSDWKNTGGVTEPQYIELRSVNSAGTDEIDSGIYPGEGASPLWINRQRVVSPNAVNVAPGENAWFIFTAKMPSTPGDYKFYFRPYHAMGGFIGPFRYFHVNVTPSYSTTTYRSSTTTILPLSTTTYRSSTTTIQPFSTTTYRSSTTSILPLSTTTYQSSTTTAQPVSTTTYLLSSSTTYLGSSTTTYAHPQWDFNADGITNYLDLGLFADHWLLLEGDPDWASMYNLSIVPDEFNRQIINYNDLGIFADHWLEETP